MESTRPQLRFLSLFAGIGGIDLGLERAGMRCVGQVEINPFARAVLAKHWPDVPRFDDVRTVSRADFTEHVDLIAGGFPCQDISIAGDRRGLGEGTRSGLWAEFFRLICELRPDFALVENVAALLVPDRSGFAPIATVLGDLAAVGFDADWSVFPACALGAPHTRERVFIVAHRGEVGWHRAREHPVGRNEVPTGFNAWQAAPRGQWRDVERWISAVVATGGGIVPAAERGGMADGIPDRLDRVGACGNAVVPQIAEWVGRRIVECA